VKGLNAPKTLPESLKGPDPFESRLSLFCSLS
jgi:hypothetical protein